MQRSLARRATLPRTLTGATARSAAETARGSMLAPVSAASTVRPIAFGGGLVPGAPQASAPEPPSLCHANLPLVHS